jgi:hypothetical protein
MNSQVKSDKGHECKPLAGSFAPDSTAVWEVVYKEFTNDSVKRIRVHANDRQSAISSASSQVGLGGWYFKSAEIVGRAA